MGCDGSSARTGSGDWRALQRDTGAGGAPWLCGAKRCPSSAVGEEMGVAGVLGCEDQSPPSVQPVVSKHWGGRITSVLSFLEGA